MIMAKDGEIFAAVRLSPTCKSNRRGKIIFGGGCTNALLFQSPIGKANGQHILCERRKIIHI
jgi:hypothetical protein